ncbi:isoleucyl-tRNA ligase [Fictibacillus macauensis ZFHKF-1]|uniref:Isoleucine--tRNA ligase n=1 Tax=Fictibacillus macauensis ZFHKF-1 TaxID=1196324 RepID=I8AMY6_9BACL|nr:isoleucyl-tRNA ligase [Fictibacillus macauensis ZFHKF-1]
MPYCPSCQTSLSSHEVAQGYKDVKDLAATVKFAVQGEARTYFLGWTTTPWTLPANVALAVNEQLSYVKVLHEGDVYIVSKARVPFLFPETAQIVSEHQGSQFVGMNYEAPFPLATLTRGYEVIAADFVTEDAGTGVVHIAPAHGEDDYRAVKERNLSFVVIVDEKGCYTEEFPALAGDFAKDCDVEIIKHLADRKLLFAKEKYEHSYPHCWRCDSPLLYYAMEGWFIETTRIKDQLQRNNEQVTWYPHHIKDGRFGNFLDKIVDWNIGRNRYWGTPLNAWICKGCQHQFVPGSIEELRQHAKSGMGEALELHRPYVDDVIVTCAACGCDMKRTKEVIDVWFDSGAMPFAQYHVPFENKELFQTQFPADVIAEGIDQTRGWFYSLLAVSTLYKGVAPYKRVLSLGHILDEHGRKMSKSKGNVINPLDLVKTYGADALRWALLADSAPWNNKRFSVNIVSQAKSKVIDTLQNVYSFYTLYQEIDGFVPTDPAGKQTLLDRWLLSRLQTVTEAVTKHLDQYDFTGGARELALFIDDLSNWYVRRSRERFWGTGLTEDKFAAYHTLYTVLVTTSQLLAPYTPFLAEDLHFHLTGTSVHLADFPVANKQE